MKKRTTGRAVVVLITCPTLRIARQLAGSLIARRLAACVNIVPGVESTFWWQGKIDHAREVLLIVKTTASEFDRLRRCVISMHPYESPEVIAMQVSAGHPPYLAWIGSSVQPR